jgi:hypothetical protein
MNNVLIVMCSGNRVVAGAVTDYAPVIDTQYATNSLSAAAMYCFQLIVWHDGDVDGRVFPVALTCLAGNAQNVL